MAPRGNCMIPNAHFHKDWTRYVKTFFDQPGRKKARLVARAKKTQAIAPRPAAGAVRPVVRCPTFKYNTKQRLGRGFTLQELKAAGISRKQAGTIGIAVDHRRRNKSVESQQPNVQRLNQYKANLVVLKNKKANLAEFKLVPQLLKPVLPIAKESKRIRARKITDEEKKARVFQGMRVARGTAHNVGLRQKRKAEKAAEAEVAAKKE
eukprot:m.25867 g.25867  ORF g.25867 m.25867 type:complete len:207 (-) comp9829_c0_seq1:227-847(-)